MMSFLLLVVLLAIAQVLAQNQGCTQAEKDAFTPTKVDSAAYECVQQGFEAGNRTSVNSTSSCFQETANFTQSCAQCATLYTECQLSECTNNCVANATAPTCTDCLNSAQGKCNTIFNSCATIPPFLIGSVNLNQAAFDYNAQVAGASIGVLCGITALLICISMTGILG